MDEHRQRIGLSTVRPSDQIAGLDEVAKRAEKAEARDVSKRRTGEIIQNVAIHVDERAERWRRIVHRSAWAGGIAAVVLLIAMVCVANWKSADERTLAQETHSTFTLYAIAAGQIPLVRPDEAITPAQFQARLAKVLEDQIKELEQAVTHQRQTRGASDAYTRERVAQLKRALLFRDGFGRALVFEPVGKDRMLVKSSSERLPEKARSLSLPIRREGAALPGTPVTAPGKSG